MAENNGAPVCAATGNGGQIARTTENLRFYNASREVPKEAQKEFSNGRFSGTDINPMWRIKKLTEMFGPAGLGWYYDVISERSETVADTVMAIVDLKLYVKDPDSGEWSKPIYGTGGNVLLAKGRASDEGYKMALTDALSVACKALGVGADIYYEKDKTKYTAEEPEKKTRRATDSSAAPQNDGGRKTAAPTPSPQGEGSAPGRQIPMGYKGVCRRCKKEIDQATEFDSMAIFSMPLCTDCQRAAAEYQRQQKQNAG